MRALQFIVVVLAVAVAATVPSFAVAQQGAAKVPRIAFLMDGTAPIIKGQLYGFSEGLADFGYVDPNAIQAFADALGKFSQAETPKIVVQFFVAPTPADLPAYAAKAVASDPQVLMTNGTPGAQALKDATSLIPVVAYTDLVGSGFAASLGHPGGNITGATNIAPDLSGKRLTLLKDSAPDAKRLAVLNVPANDTIAREAAATVEAAKALDLDPIVIDFDQSQPLGSQMTALAQAKAQSAYVANANFFNANKDALCAFFDANRIASVSSASFSCSLVGYGPDAAAQYRKQASYVDAILKGAKPTDLPVQEPNQFDVVLDLATAKAIGLAIPQSMLLQATQVIE